MAYCKECGEEKFNPEGKCSYCGFTPEKKQQSNGEDGGFLWGLLGFCVPLVGLVLYLVWKDEKPNTANALITGAAIGFVIGIFGSILSLGM